MKNRLNHKEVDELLTLLRKNLLYQTPRPVFATEGDEQPTWVDLRFVFQHQQRILILLNKAGGWCLSNEDKQAVLRQHEERARVAHGNGTDYDFTHLSYGELVQMHVELEGINHLQPFRTAIATAISMEVK